MKRCEVKENAKSTNTSIKLTEVCTVDGENIVKVENNEKEIKIKGKFSFKNIFTNIKNTIFNIFNRK